jgi:hypothetical protein
MRLRHSRRIDPINQEAGDKCEKTLEENAGFHARHQHAGFRQ